MGRSRLIIWYTLLLTLLLSMPYFIRSFSPICAPSALNSIRFLSTAYASSPKATSEYLLSAVGSPLAPVSSSLTKSRQNLICFEYPSVKNDTVIWSSHRNNIQLDTTQLEAQFLGRHQLSEKETARRWGDILDGRIRVFDKECVDLLSKTSDVDVGQQDSQLGDGGKLQRELDAAIAAVHKASFMSRSLQKFLLRGHGAQSKDDNSPVTIADFAVQALVIHILSLRFPTDRFIAEESSDVLRENDVIRTGVIEALSAATGHSWSDDMLFSTVDKGQFDGGHGRVWVLDPVDGTKGFMRGQHYCIALALLIDGVPSLSVLGCPNLSLDRVLQPHGASNQGLSVSQYIEAVAEPYKINGYEGQEVLVYPPSTGSVFFAVTGRGAFARSLALQLGGAFEVQVSFCPDASDSTLCEAVEPSHGDRAVTARVFESLKLRKDFIRLDGQCKYAVVGAGAAEGNMRLPPSGYREKIWDHAAGSHFIIEAGGEVTDLSGCRLDFSQGRYLSADVTGILASNGLLHKKLLSAIAEAKAAEEREIITGRKQTRIFGQDS